MFQQFVFVNQVLASYLLAASPYKIADVVSRLPPKANLAGGSGGADTGGEHILNRNDVEKDSRSSVLRMYAKLVDCLLAVTAKYTDGG